MVMMVPRSFSGRPASLSSFSRFSQGGITLRVAGAFFLAPLSLFGCSGDDTASSDNHADASRDAAIDRHEGLAGDASSDRTAADDRGIAVDVSTDAPAHGTSAEQPEDEGRSESSPPDDASGEIAIGDAPDAAT